jgi:biopolymer transport protein ExbD
VRNPRFRRKHRVSNTIPTVSMGDIAFLLLIFFMATAAFKMDEGLKVELPEAEAMERPRRERVTRIWVDRGGRVSVGDQIVPVGAVADIIKARILERPDLIVALNADHRVAYGVVADVIEELKEANAVRLSLTSDREEAGATPARPPR